MADYQTDNFRDQRTPVQCRNGPLEERSCTDCFCCIIYILLIAAVIFLGIFSAQIKRIDQDQVEQQLSSEAYGKPFLAIQQALPQILVSLMFVAGLSLLLVITTFLIPSIVTYIYIPLFLILLAVSSALFFMRYIGGTIPLISVEKQNQWAATKSTFTLITAIIFLITFLIILIVIITKRGKFKHILPILQIAKMCYWDNTYLLLISIVLTILSIGSLALNILILAISQDRQVGQQIINPTIFGIIVLVELLWTHGVLQALSDFFCESVAVEWYFTQRRDDEEKGCCSTFCKVLKLCLRHIGTVAYGHILAYIPETLNTKIGSFQKTCPCFYNIFCIWHRFTFRHLTKYCFIQTTLQSLPFCAANREMFGLRTRTKATLPQLYMMGNFYITMSKIFIIMSALALNYILLAQAKEDLMKNILNLIAPLIVTLFGSLEIAGHFMNTTGLVADTITFMYTADLEIEKKHFGEMNPYSCPHEVEEIIHQIKVGEILDDEV